MKKNRFMILIAACLLCFSACKHDGDKTDDKTAEEKTTKSEEGTSSPTRYSLKSAKVTTTTQLQGMGTNKSTLYFDDYGKKEMRENSMSMSAGGREMNITSRTIMQTDYIYTWQVGQKTGTKIKIGEKFNPADINYKELTEEMKNKYHMKDEGTENIMGKTCKVYSYDAETMKGKAYIWENIPMKTEMTISGRTVVAEVTDFQENIDIPAAEFEVPSDIVFKEPKIPNIPNVPKMAP